MCTSTCYHPASDSFPSRVSRYPNLSLSRDVACPSAHTAPESDGKSHDKCSWDQVFRLHRGFLRSQQGQDPEEGDESLLRAELRPFPSFLQKATATHSILLSRGTATATSSSGLGPQRCLHVVSPNSSSSMSPIDEEGLYSHVLLSPALSSLPHAAVQESKPRGKKRSERTQVEHVGTLLWKTLESLARLKKCGISETIRLLASPVPHLLSCFPSRDLEGTTQRNWRGRENGGPQPHTCLGEEGLTLKRDRVLMSRPRSSLTGPRRQGDRVIHRTLKRFL